MGMGYRFGQSLGDCENTGRTGQFDPSVAAWNRRKNVTPGASRAGGS
jgi:hypothetical protein